MYKKKLIAALSLALCGTVTAHAFIVKSVQILGLERVPLNNVKPDVPIQVGEDVTVADTNAIINDLYKTGYFSDIAVYNQNGNVVIQVQELPTIAKVTITGNQMIKTDQLQTVLNSIGLQVGNMLNHTLLRQVQQSLEQEYNSQGKYAVRVSTLLAPVSNNRVNVTITVSEGLTAKIARIDIVGNHAFSVKTLLHQITLTTPGPISFFTGNDKYSTDKMNKSLQQLSDFYMNHGYINMRINSTQMSLDSTHTKSFITINLTEGDKYTFSDFKLTGDLILPEAQLAALVKIRPGTTFSKQEVMDAQKAIIYALGNKGYAFVNVNPVPTIDDAKKQVFITFYLTPGQKVYVHNINYSGNTVTNDKTLRERMQFVEGSTYSKSAIDNSTLGLQRLPYMQQVTETAVPVPGTTNQVNVNYNLQEKSANSVTGNVGYSDLYGLLLGGNFNVPNIFGTGNIFNINAQVSQPYQNVNVGFTEPYFTDNAIQQSVNFYFTRQDAGEEGLADYSTNSFGATLNYSIPISAWNAFTFGGGYDHTQLQQPGDSESLTVSDFTQQYGNNYNTYSLNFGLTRNSTNNAYFPTQGDEGSLIGTVAVPGSNLTWYKLTASELWYHALTDSVTMSLGGAVGYGNGYNGLAHLPFFDNFFAGGWGSGVLGTVRGYEAGGLGPQDTVICTDATQCTVGSASEGQALGGNLLLNANATLYFPVPFADTDSLKLITFLDAGNVYNTYTAPNVWDDQSQPTSPSFTNIQYSAGIGMEWASPLGAMAFSLAVPLGNKQNADTQLFQFSLGTFF